VDDHEGMALKKEKKRKKRGKNPGVYVISVKVIFL
jgi:hypothetical protein